MAQKVEIWIVIAMAALVVIASLVLTSHAGATKHEKRDKLAFRCLGATNVAFLTATAGLILGQIVPFWFSAAMVIFGMLLGIVLGYMALLIGAGQTIRPSLYLLPAVCLGLVQGALAVLLGDLTVLILSSSSLNGALALVFAWRLWRLSAPWGRELALLASAPFAAIAAAYLARLVMVVIGAGPDVMAVATLLITFLVAFSALQWGFTLLAFRAARLNRSLATARDAAEEASRIKSRFLANMSHEIRTPLNAILGMTQVLEQVIAEPEQTRALGTIRDSGENLLMTLNDILDLSLVQGGRLTVAAQPFDLAHLVRKITDLHAMSAREKGLNLGARLDLPDGSWRCGDARRVQQIFSNLLGNAIKFTERGHVSCGVSGTRHHVCLWVEDTGIGMSAAQQQRAFDAFVQADVSVTRRFGGTGLGLPIVKELVQALGGGVSLHSVPQEGTRVEVHLPLACVAAPSAHDRTLCVVETRAPVLSREHAQEALPVAPIAPCLPPDAGRASPRQADAVQHKRPPQTAPAPHQDMPGPGIRVLVAEDSPVNQRVLIALMRGLPCHLTIVDNGAQALDLARSASFDLFLFDIMMPEMDGVTALREIAREYEALDRVRPPALAVTANVAPEQIREYRDSGFDDVIAKPISRKHLLSALGALGLAVDLQVSAPVSAASTDATRPAAPFPAAPVLGRARAGIPGG
ncbi:MAG: ATP-binding protein [Roseinatronobacter sp.]